MKRRTLLSSLASIGAVGVTGCIDDSSPGDSGTDNTTTDEPGTTPDDGTDTPDGTDDDDGSEFNPDEQTEAARFEVGSPEGVAFANNNKPVPVHVRNDADEERDFALQVTRPTPGPSDDLQVRDLGTTTLSADAYVTVMFYVPATYTLTVDGNGETLHEHQLGHGDFTCNSGFTSITVAEDWSVETSGVSTRMACPSPSARTVGVGQGEGECADGEDHTATVSYGDEEVTVEGAFVTPTPCYSVEVTESNYDEETDEFELVLVATENDAESCVECVGVVDYESTVGFEADFPAHVSVVHRTNDGDTEVARATWNAGFELGGDDAAFL
ncbi:hypothetical protein [Haloarchaeobius iranensis]|uniref:Uncharacterized protein n=1 Tax=Haloarchaeobius iranensis TaxID=996166 RepID=A0A1G9V0X1_9EURY|nr:hypothetical protein [Haloarchaeobius iranensis]SDM65862.1 hypothetical protein SAMN05192554_105128 [Haloarchaeobius iranensis]